MEAFSNTVDDEPQMLKEMGVAWLLHYIRYSFLLPIALSSRIFFRLYLSTSHNLRGEQGYQSSLT
jgi:hypothetical protein